MKLSNNTNNDEKVKYNKIWCTKIKRKKKFMYMRKSIILGAENIKNIYYFLYKNKIKNNNVYFNKNR